MSKKTTKRKPAKTPEGITSKKTSTGINVTISTNGRVLCTMRGYNNNQNVQKGLAATHAALEKALIGMPTGPRKYNVTDLTPKPKKATKKA